MSGSNKFKQTGGTGRGTTIGVTLGFMLSLLFENPLLIMIGIVIGGGIDSYNKWWKKE